jgi:ribosomal protein L22
MENNKQIVSATSRYIRVPSKIDVILRKFVGKAIKKLTNFKIFTSKLAIVWQTLYSAISNATNNFDLERKLNHYRSFC